MAMGKILIFPLIIVCFTPAFSSIADIPVKIGLGVKELQILNSSLQLESALAEYSKVFGKNQKTETFCASCRRVVQEIIKYRRNGASRQSFQSYLQKICPIVTQYAEVVCSGHIDIELDSLIYIIDNKHSLTPDRVCAVIFQQNNCTDPEEKQWSVEIAPKKSRDNRIPEAAQTPQNQEGPLRILHLTDIHYDPEYVPLSNADCGLPLCCHKTDDKEQNAINNNGTKAEAGFWGDYHSCDMPWYTITSLMDHLSAKYGGNYFDLVYYTGDIISHKSWATSREKNEAAIRKLYQLFGETFQNASVFPILGNHEPSPSNFYSPDNVSNPLITTKWTLDLASEEWSKWLPDYTKHTIKSGGFYTVLVRPGFRIIGLNSNVCFTSNYWLVYEDKDPYGQLQWLAEVLKQAEKNSELVHILSHIPPGDRECLQQWTVQFRRIVERFSHIISAQFNGHTHLDEFRLFYDKTDKNVINIAYNGGSFTTFIGNNPNYKIYTVDSGTLQVLDYDQYIYNLTLANQNNSTSPNWFKYYSLKEAYGLENLHYDDFTQLMTRLSSDKVLQQQYYQYQTRGGDAFISTVCNDDCLSGLVCEIKAVEARETLQCENSV